MEFDSKIAKAASVALLGVLPALGGCGHQEYHEPDYISQTDPAKSSPIKAEVDPNRALSERDFTAKLALMVEHCQPQYKHLAKLAFNANVELEKVQKAAKEFCINVDKWDRNEERLTLAVTSGEAYKVLSDLRDELFSNSSEYASFHDVAYDTLRDCQSVLDMLRFRQSIGDVYSGHGTTSNSNFALLSQLKADCYLLIAATR